MLSNKIVKMMTEKGLNGILSSFIANFMFGEECRHHQSASNGLDCHYGWVLLILVLLYDKFNIRLLIERSPIHNFEFSHH